MQSQPPSLVVSGPTIGWPMSAQPARDMVMNSIKFVVLLILVTAALEVAEGAFVAPQDEHARCVQKVTAQLLAIEAGSRSMAGEACLRAEAYLAAINKPSDEDSKPAR